MVDAIVLSDLHLGSRNCQAALLNRFLREVLSGERPTRRLVINGDLFDSIDFRRLKKGHWKVLSRLRKLAKRMPVIWINGNHDGSAEIVSHLLGVKVRDEFILVSGTRRILLLHGHRFDRFIEAHPIATWFADRVYRFLQAIDRSHAVARSAKRSSKLFLRCSRLIEEESMKYTRTRGCTAVCCGHTHLATVSRQDGIAYFNSGCWTEKPCHFLTINEGEVEVAEYASERPAHRGSAASAMSLSAW